MRTAMLGFLGAFLLLGRSGDVSAAIYPYNGHWYEPVSVSAGINWSDAEAAAVSQGGYLATIQDSAENSFVFSLINDPIYWTGTEANGDIIGPWLGGYNNTGNPPSQGWNWVTGEPFNYPSPPWGPSQPDGYGGYPQALEFYAGNSIGPTWGDNVQTGNSGYSLAQGYVIEFNSQPAGTVPEPAALVVWSLLGSAGIGLGWWRSRKVG